MKHQLLLQLALFAIISTGVLSAKAHDITIIPQPASIDKRQGEFTLNAKTSIGYDESLKELATYLQTTLSTSTGFDLPLLQKGKKAKINLRIDRSKVSAEEGYRLEVNAKEVNVYGATPGGVFYGVQSFLQLFPAQIYNAHTQKNVAWAAPAVVIDDAPNHPWRGMMLDVARYFYDKEFVKKFIDMMAMYKMNKLQFHLIDDSGWRLEIKKYPRLTEVGAWAGPKDKRIGGFYTQEDIKEIVAYAALRNVEVIPEIEFPAHILSAVVAYPWLSCTGEQHEVPLQHFISRDLLCAGKPSSLQFLSDVLDETVALFPSKYINIGGDEAVYDRWKECPHCQALMKREGLKEAGELQGYLVNVVSDMMKKKGRTCVGWEEIIMRGEIKNPVVALIWNNAKDSVHAVRTGHKAVLTPATHMYFDFPESKTPGEIKAATWRPPFSVKHCYEMPINDYSASSAVIGVQGCYWTDQFIHGDILRDLPQLDENRSVRYAEYLMFPRLLAAAEVGWTKSKQRRYDSFAARLFTHYARLDNKDCYYRLPEPIIVSEEKASNGDITFTLQPSVPGSKILYTTNGDYPTVHSAEYRSPVTVSKKSDFHAITYVNNRRYSLPIYFAPDYSAYNKYGTFAAEWTPMQIKKADFVWTFDATGKLWGNGQYEVTFIHTEGESGLQLGDLELYKRDEKMVSVAHAAVINTTATTTTYALPLNGFEAGTPFQVRVKAKGVNGNTTSGLVFIKKLKEQ